MRRRAVVALFVCAFAYGCTGFAYAHAPSSPSAGASGPGVHGGCKVRTGDRVALYGTSDDPDVFIWDSRFRMRDYEGGSFDQMRALLPHATLAPAGTRATVESCVDDFVQSKFLSTPDDAIGVVITSGPLRGTRGWVVGDAIRIVWHR